MMLRNASSALSEPAGRETDAAHAGRLGRAEVAGLALAVAGGVVALDQLAKGAVLSTLLPNERIKVFPGLELTRVHNRGVAFGLFPGYGTVVTVAILLSLAVLVAYLIARHERPLLWIAVGLVLGGALGNLADRVRADAVTDFIDPVLWPAFNLADVAIVVGILTLVYAVETPGRGRGDRT